MGKFKLIFYNLLIFIIFCSGIELFARFVFEITEEDNKNNFRRELKQKAFGGIEDEASNYFSKCPKEKIIAEGVVGSLIKYANKDWACGGITVKDNKRVTIGQQYPFEKTVHVFGGSTVFGTGASDKYTIPSLLQSKLNDLDNSFRVINHGFASLVAIQQLQKLSKTNVNEGDIVIFYDGGNDVVQREIYNKPKGTIVGYNKENKVGFFLSNIRHFLGQNSKFYYYLAKLKLYTQGNAKSQKKSICEANEFNKVEFEKKWLSYYQTLIEAKNMIEAKNASFYHFLQPFLDYSLLEESDLNYLKAIGVKPNYDLCFVRLLSSSYQNLSFSYSDFSSQINGTSLADALKNSSLDINPGYFFIDYIHITAKGNKIVAEAIFSKIFK